MAHNTENTPTQLPMMKYTINNKNADVGTMNSTSSEEMEQPKSQEESMKDLHCLLLVLIIVWLFLLAIAVVGGTIVAFWVKEIQDNVQHNDDGSDILTIYPEGPSSLVTQD